MSHRFSSTEDAAIIAGYSRRPLSAIAARLGLDPGSVVAHSHVLEGRGLVNPARRYYGRPWTPEEVEQLRGLWGWRDAQTIAKALGRTFDACVLKAKSLGLSRKWRGRYTAREVGKVFNQDGKTVVRWIERGFLAGTRSPVGAGGHQRWEISHEAVIAFIRDHPTRYALEWIRDPYWRELALGADRARDALKVSEAARLLFCHQETVRRHLRKGWLAGERIPWAGGQAWRIRRADLGSFAFHCPPRRHAKGRRGALPRRAL